MNAPAARPPDFAAPAKHTLAAAALIVCAALAAWHNSFDGPFVLDDVHNIEGNASIRHLAALGTVLSPPADLGVGGRPLLNLSFAFNYAIGRYSVGSYHAFNLAIHIFAGLALLDLARRTFLTATLRARFGRDATVLATAIALLWTLHPVQTSSVTYVSQRAESLMGLFYLLTLYGFTRANDSAQPSRWHLAVVAACALGMVTKEVMVTAPLAVLLYDRTFVAGSFRAALRERRWLYFALALTWLPLPFVMTTAAQRGVGTERGIAWTTYALTECRELLHYVQLSFWPQPLVLDRSANFLKTFWDAAPYALVLGPLLAATGWLVARRPVAGFLPAWFFGVLAPTSSVVPVAFMPFAENRLYLPLVAVATAVGLAVHALAGRRTLLVALVPAVACGWLTEKRNRCYRSDLELWADAVEKCPDNPHARYNYGLMLSRDGHTAAAAAQWLAALRDEPFHPPAHENLANALVSLGRVREALPHYEIALHQHPDFPLARANYGLVLLYLGRTSEAEQQLQLALKQEPNDAGVLTNFGILLDRFGRSAEAIGYYEAALRANPDFADAHHNLGVALSRTGRLPDAIAHFEIVARLRPNSVDARLNVVRGFLQASRLVEAQSQIETTLEKFPSSPDAHLLRGNVLALMGQLPAAIVEYERALALRPNFADAQQNLAQVRARLR